MWGGRFFYDRENGRGGAKFWLVVSVPGFPYVSHRFHFLWASILVHFFGPQLSRTFFGPQFCCTCLDLDSLPRMYKQLREPQRSHGPHEHSGDAQPNIPIRTKESLGIHKASLSGPQFPAQSLAFRGPNGQRRSAAVGGGRRRSAAVVVGLEGSEAMLLKDPPHIYIYIYKTRTYTAILLAVLFFFVFL